MDPEVCYICTKYGHNPIECPSPQPDFQLILKNYKNVHSLADLKNLLSEYPSAKLFLYYDQISLVGFTDQNECEFAMKYLQEYMSCTINQNIVKYIPNSICYNCGLQGHFAKHCFLNYKEPIMEDNKNQED